MRILEDYELTYSKERLEEILSFLDINNCNKFSLQEFINNIQLCKLINTSIGIS